MQSRFYIHKLNAERKFSEIAEEMHVKFYLPSKRWMEIMYCRIFYRIIWILFAAFQRKIAFRIILDDFRRNKWHEHVFCRSFFFWTQTPAFIYSSYFKCTILSVPQKCMVIPSVVVMFEPKGAWYYCYTEKGCGTNGERRFIALDCSWKRNGITSWVPLTTEKVKQH